jgi:hypothetical protein
MRGSAAMRLVCPVVEEFTPLVRHTMWDRIEAELEAVEWGSADERGRLRSVARAAIVYGREVSK